MDHLCWLDQVSLKMDKYDDDVKRLSNSCNRKLKKLNRKTTVNFSGNYLPQLRHSQASQASRLFTLVFILPSIILRICDIKWARLALLTDIVSVVVGLVPDDWCGYSPTVLYKIGQVRRLVVVSPADTLHSPRQGHATPPHHHYRHHLGWNISSLSLLWWLLRTDRTQVSGQVRSPPPTGFIRKVCAPR